MATIQALTDQLKKKYSNAITAVQNPAPSQLFIDIKKEKMREMAGDIISAGGRYLVSVGTDNLAANGTLGMIHTFGFDREHYFLALRTGTKENEPIDSITPDIPNAGWSEREYMDLLGMKFNGHPKPKRLVVADDWPADIYPLRKEVPFNIKPLAAENVAYQLDECPEGCSIVPFGPYHPTQHEPAHFALYVDGETIKGSDYRGFMIHRGVEKLAQTQITYNEIPFLAERICGICGSVHAATYSQSVEIAAGIKISRRAEYIRTIMLELERIHSHLLWLGVAGHLIGFDTVFMQAWRVREPIMWLGERITGNRKTYGMIVIGGVRRDITPAVKEDILGVVNKIEEEMLIIKNAIIGDTAIHRRTKDVGYITKEDTVKWSLVGPVARARGVDIDARRDYPYAAYPEMNFSVPVVDTCDVWGTVLVRVLEVFEAVNIIRQALDKIPNDGPILTEIEKPIEPGKHGMSAVEAPRGEVTHYVITGEENRPERWRVRAPTYPNLQGVPMMLLGNQLADVPIIIGSIDPCFSCTERVEVVDINRGTVKVMSQSEFETLSRTKR